jgi:hypothetical protein
MPNGGFREEPVYRLTRRECLYVATKYNDEARAKLIVQGEELEEKNLLESRARRAFFLGFRGRCVDCHAASRLAMTRVRTGA